MNRKWDNFFMGLAVYVSSNSKDPSTKVGAVLVGTDKRHVAIGYNGFPPGIEDTPERLNHRPTKLVLMQHAERNVLDNAAFDTRGATLYATLCPCAECAKSIISKGVIRVVCPMPSDDQFIRWGESFSMAQMMLSEADVALEFWRP